MSTPEPWLRGTLQEVPVTVRAVLHALEQAEEDIVRWAGSLTTEQIHGRAVGLPSVGFHLQHIAGSLDRLLTYAEGRTLTTQQLAALAAEDSSSRSASELMEQVRASLRDAQRRVRQMSSANLDAAREVGRKRLPTTTGGLLVHCAEHTMRHVGQLITTAKLVQHSGT